MIPFGDVAREYCGWEYFEGLQRCFENVGDPRVVGRCDRQLLDIISIALLAVMCGAEDWPDVEPFGESREDWLKTFRELPNGIPSHDTFRRVFGRRDRGPFAAGLFVWTQALHQATGGKVIAIDGKQVRTPTDEGGASCEHARVSGGRSPGRGGWRCCTWSPRPARLPAVSTWATENHLTLGQVACEEKSNGDHRDSRAAQVAEPEG